MCLDRVYKTYKGTSRKVITRYKLFTINKGKIYPFMPPQEDPLPEGVWLDERLYRPSAWRFEKDVVLLKNAWEELYPTGWHVYENEGDGWHKIHLMRNVAYEVGEDKGNWYPTYRVAEISYGGKDLLQQKFALYEVECRGLLAKGIENEGHSDSSRVPVEVYKYIKIGRRLQEESGAWKLWERSIGGNLPTIRGKL